MFFMPIPSQAPAQILSANTMISLLIIKTHFLVICASLTKGSNTCKKHATHFHMQIYALNILPQKRSQFLTNRRQQSNISNESATTFYPPSPTRLFHLNYNKEHIFPYPIQSEPGNLLCLYVKELFRYQNLIFFIFGLKTASVG